MPVALESLAPSRVLLDDPSRLVTLLRGHWARKSVFLSACQDGPLFPPELVFDAYKACAEAEQNDREHVKFYFRENNEGRMGPWTLREGAEAAPFLPRRLDPSIDGYFDRIRDQHGICELSAQLRYNLAHYSPELWRIARGFLHRALETAGFPAAGWNIDCYLGQYASTPFGVHRDYEDQFYFVSLGEKTMHLWTDEEWKSVSDPARYAWDHRRHAGPRRSHVVTPGDMVYWPRETWHIGESFGRSISVQINMRRGSRERATHEIAESVTALLLRATASTDAAFWWEPTRPSDVDQNILRPDAAMDALEGVVREMISNGSLRREIDSRRLRRLAAWYAVDEDDSPFSLPPRGEGRCTGTRIRLRADMALLWTGDTQRSLVVATNGRRFGVKNSEAVRTMLGHLASRDWVECEVDPAGGDDDSRRGVATLVAGLARSGAIESS